MNKKILIILIAIILVVGIFIISKTFKKDKTIDTMTNKADIENMIENNLENELSNTIYTMPGDTSIEDNNKDINEEENLGNNAPASNTGDKKEKAIEIVKKDWGEDSTVNFICEGQNAKGEYIICVREKSTTRAIFWYYVDVDNGTFTTD